MEYTKIHIPNSGVKFLFVGRIGESNACRSLCSMTVLIMRTGIHLVALIPAVSGLAPVVIGRGGSHLPFCHTRSLWRVSISTDQDGFPITTVGNDRDRDRVQITAVGHNHSLLSSPQVVGGDPSERKGSLDSRQKQAGRTTHFRHPRK